MPWEYIRNSTKYGAPCLQLKDDKNVIGNEDCLTLNVFVPNVLSKSLLPVMILIFGGGYFVGDASSHDPTFLMDYQNVILVKFCIFLVFFIIIYYDQIKGYV